MNLKIKRILIASLLAEILGVLALIILVMIFGPNDKELTQTFAENLGKWVGPISGFVLCLLGGFWVAKESLNPVLNGLSMGIAGAILDISIAILLGASVSQLLIASNTGRVLAGTIGGWLASKKTPSENTV